MYDDYLQLNTYNKDLQILPFSQPWSPPPVLPSSMKGYSSPTVTETTPRTAWVSSSHAPTSNPSLSSGKAVFKIYPGSDYISSPPLSSWCKPLPSPPSVLTASLVTCLPVINSQCSSQSEPAAAMIHQMIALLLKTLPCNPMTPVYST